ncbi:MAG: DUF3494 domain-containing protein, partial [Flavobacteriales bacterium]|nr:DUF3494 domain-containing protein [Flavobacteriales bacterium]
RWDGAKWTNHGNGGTTGDPSSGTVSSAGPVSDFGAFVLGSATAAIPTVDDIDLGAAAGFAVLAGNNIETDNLVVAVGNVGAIGSISDSVVATDSVFGSNDPEVQQAIADLNSAINTIKDIPGSTISSNLNSLNLSEGVYEISGNSNLSGTLTLNGDTSSIFVFKIDDTLNVDSGAVLELGNVRPNNVYWVTLNSYTTIGPNTNFSGIVMSGGNMVSAGKNTGSLALLSTLGKITLVNNRRSDPAYLTSGIIMLKTALLGADTVITTVGDVGVCGDTVTFEIDIVLTSVHINEEIIINISLPQGLEYLQPAASTLYTLSDNTLSPDMPYFTIQATPPDTIMDTLVTVSYDVIARCGAFATDSAEVSTTVQFTNTIDSVTIIDTIKVLTPVISIPQTNGLVPELLEGNVGDTLCRNIVIENAGEATLFSGFTIIENFGPAIEIISLSIDSISLPMDTVGNQLTIFVPDSLLPSGVLLPLEEITIKECVQLISCTSDSTAGASTFIYFWECDSVVCQEDSVTATAKVPSANFVDLKFPRTFLKPDVCYGPDNSTKTQLVVRNSGLAPALNSSIQLNGGSFSAITDLNFEYVNALGDTAPAPLTAYGYNLVPGFCKDSVIDFARFDLGNINPLDSVILLFNTTTCCPSDTICGEGASRSFFFDFQYQDQCRADTDTVRLPILSIFSEVASSNLAWESGLTQLLSDLSCAQVDTGDHVFENTAGLRRWKGDSTEAILVVFTLDTGLCYDNFGSNSLVFVSDTITWQPDSIVANIDSAQCGGTVSGWFPLPSPTGFDWSTAKYHIRIFGNCPAPPAGNLSLEVFHVPTRDTSCASPCVMSLACGLVPVSIQCCGCDRHGTENTFYEAKRISLGGPDNNNNGVYDTSGTVNPLALDMVTVGDTLQVQARAFVQQLTYPLIPTFSDTLFKFAYYSHMISNATCRDAVTHLDALAHIYDADTTDAGCNSCAATYEFTIPADSVLVSGAELRYDMSIDKIIGYGGVPTSNHFAFDDSIVIFPRFIVSDNIGPIEQDCFTGPNYIFLGIAASPACDDPASNGGRCEPDSLIGDSVEDCLGNRFSQCDSTIRFACTKQNGAFKLLGYSYASDAKIVFGCPSRTSVTSIFNIGTTGKNNDFENEYRHFGIMDTAIVEIPPGFVFDSVEITQRRLNGSTMITQKINDNIIPDSISGDTTLYFSLSKYFSTFSGTSSACSVTCITNSLYPGDEEVGYTVLVYFHPTCSTASDTINLAPYVGFSPAFNADSGQVFAGNPGFSQGVIIYRAPSFKINEGIQKVDGVTREVCWKGWDIENRGGIGYNFWMIDSSPSGNITITDLIVDNDTFPKVNGAFQIGTFPAGPKSSKSVVICAEYACDTLPNDSIYIYFGWNCPDYPTSISDYPCQADSFVLTVWPKISILQDDVVLSSSNMDICDTLTVDVAVSSAGVGNLYDIIVETEILGGSFIDAASATFTYPDSNSTDSITPPIPTGSTYTWDINNLNAFIANNGLPGSGFTVDDDFTEFVLSFDLVGNCDLERVNRVVTKVYGITNCGDIDSTATTNSTFTINNYPSAIPKALTLSSTNFSTCDSIATITVEIVHNDSLNTTDANDLFNFMLPPCAEFVQGSFVDSIQGPTDSVPGIIGNTLTWNLLPGVFANSDSLMVFQFDIQITGSTCGTSYILEGNTTVPDSLFCKIDTSTTDSSFCQFNIPAGVDTTIATLPGPLSLDSVVISNGSCKDACDGSATAFVSGGVSPYAFSWANLDSTVLGTGVSIGSLCADTLTLMVTDSNNCNIVDTVVISEPDILAALIVGTVDVSCAGGNDGTVDLSVSGGTTPYTFLWSTGATTEDISGLLVGAFSVTVTDANGCTSIDSAMLSQPPPLTTSVVQTLVSCNSFSDGSVDLSVSGGLPPYSFNWSNGANTEDLSGLSSGIYHVTVTDSLGCNKSNGLLVGEPLPLTLNFSITNLSCKFSGDGAIDMAVSGGVLPYSYIWLLGDTTEDISGLSAATYTVTVTDNHGCIANGAPSVSEPTALGVTLDTNSTSSCLATNGSVTATPSGGTPPYTYLWDDTSAQTNQTAAGLGVGSYSVTVTDNNGCTRISSTLLESVFTLFITSSNVVCPGPSAQGTASVQASNGVPPYTYQWDDPQEQTNSVATGLNAGIYTVTVTDANGCTVPNTTQVIYGGPSLSTITLTSDLDLTGATFSYEQITVPDGFTLTIQNSTVQFLGILPGQSVNSGIIVEPGAKLIVDSSSILTNLPGCSLMWRGIRVTGAEYLINGPNDSTLGSVEIKEGSIVENAHTGIHSGCDCNDVAGPFPGIVKINSGSKMINNRRHVLIGNNAATDDFILRGEFEDAQFLCTAPLIDTVTYNGEGTDEFVRLINLENAQFRGCTFDNTGPFATDKRGTGIQSYDGNYTVDRSCDVLTQSGDCAGQRTKFEGLTYGVRANDINSMNVIEITGSEFINVQRGIYLSNSYGSKLNSNIFDMPVSQSVFPYGIYLDGSTAYEVEENEFFTANSQTLTIGIVANNSGSSGDELYRNQFHDLGVGIQTQGQSGFNSNAGLQIKCNDFINDVNFFDILNVTGDIGNPQGQCDLVSFDPTLPAGNTFSHPCLSTSDDIFANSSTFFIYNHHDDTLRTPECFSTVEINPNDCPVDFTPATSCPSNFTITGNPCGFGPGPCGPVIVKLKGKTAELRTAFDSLLDRGNTAALLATVATQSAGQVKNVLMAAAPYVSDTVLLAYLNKPTKGKNHVSPGHVKEVIVVNSPVTGPVKVATDNRNLPPGIQNQIDAAQIGISPRSEQELEIAFFERQLSLKLNSLSRFFLHDSLTVNGVDSVIDILKSQDGINRELQLTEAYIEAERLTEAKLQLDILDLKGGFANFCKINNIIIDILEDSAAFDTLIADTTLKLTVENIADDTLKHGYLQARAILSMVFGTRFMEYIEPLPQQIQLKTSGDSESDQLEETVDLILSEEIQQESPNTVHWIMVYPNPADKTVTIDYSLAANTSNAELCVYDIFGTKVYQQPIPEQRGAIQHDVSGLPQGIYLYTITANQAVISKEKIMVIR